MSAMFSSHRPIPPVVRSALLGAVALAFVWSGAAPAQKTVEGRVDRLEQELRAVQRKVFPNGPVVSPEVGPATPGVSAPTGTPATSPVTDLTARVTAIEAQLAQLTGQVEENGNRVAKLEEAIAKLSAPPPVPVAAVTPPTAPSVTPTGPAARPQPTTPKPQPVASSPSLVSRNEQVAAVERPSTGNAPLDGFTYGYRLWSAKFYPEAQTQLLAILEKYGNDPIASRTQNLLGRAYLDDGKPVTAAKTLYENYRLRPKGDRAAESLAWTAEALIKANDAARACAAYDELADVFGTTMPAAVRDMMVKGRVRAKCGA